MKLTFDSIGRLVLVFSALGMASCSLPPEAAWHVVKTDGLFPLIAMEMGKKPYPANIAAYSSKPIPPNQYLATPSDPAQRSNSLPLAVVHVDAPKPAVAVTPPRPERYEQDAVVQVEPKRQPPKPNLITKKRSDSEEAPPVRKSPEPEHAPAVIATVKPRPSVEVAPEPQPKKQPVTNLASSAPTKKLESEPVKPTAPVKVEDNLPYGVAVAGRPGLVNSPYANKNQFVDVAGLKPGQEVKCPYSGKLFRVPVGVQASGNTKPAQAPDKGDDKKQ